MQHYQIESVFDRNLQKIYECATFSLFTRDQTSKLHYFVQSGMVKC